MPIVRYGSLVAVPVAASTATHLAPTPRAIFDTASCTRQPVPVVRRDPLAQEW